MRRRFYLAICALFLFSGAAGLILQLIWARRLALVFGSTIHSTATTAATFLLGLGVGAFLSSRYLTRRGQLLRTFGLLEIGVGLSSVLVTWLIPRIIPAVVALTRSHSDELSFGLMRFAMVFALLIIPCTLMGATLPVLTHHFVHSHETFGPVLARLYTINTLGGALGVMLADFALVGRIGVWNTALVAAVFDVTVGLLALLTSRRAPPAPEVVAEGASPRIPTILALLLFAVGFCGLALEIIWTRLLVFVNGTDIHAFSLVLATFLIGLVLGSFLLGTYLERRTALPVSACLLTLGWLSLISLLVANQMGPLSKRLLPVLGVDGSRVVVNALMILPSATVLGMLFPLVNAALFRHFKEAGRTVGQAYVWNTAGTLLGSLLAGFALIPWLGLQGSLIAISLLAAAVGVAYRPTLASGLVLAALAVVSFALPRDFLLRTLYAGDYSHLMYHAEDHLSSVALVGQWSDLEQERNPNLIVDGYTMMHNDLRSKRYASMLALAPCVLQERPEDVLVICLGLANTVAAAVHYAGTARVDVVELSPKVPEAVRHLEYARAALDSPKVRVTVADGRNYLLTTDRLYDVITAEPPPPRNAGIVNLYSREYYELCRQRLKPGGLVAHWLPIGLMTRFQARTTLRAFSDVFPYTYLFQGEDLHVCMVGSLQPLDLRSELLRERLGANLEWLEPLGLDEELFLAAYLRGPEEVRAYVADTPPLTDDRPYLQYDLSFDEPDWSFFFGGPGLPGGEKARAALRQLPTLAWMRSGSPTLDRLVQLEAARAALRDFPDNVYFLTAARCTEPYRAQAAQAGPSGGFSRARIAFSLGDLAGATRELDALAELARDSESALFIQLFRALVLAEQGKTAEAAALYRASTSPDPRLQQYIETQLRKYITTGISTRSGAS